MFFHENEKCPVCDSFFSADDDIVICPVCGTPHHRECYNKLGHCANTALHKDGFEYTANKNEKSDSTQTGPDADDSSSVKENTKQQNGTANADKTLCKKCNKKISKNAPFCCYCGAKQDNPQYDKPNANPLFSAGFTCEYEDNGEKIDGKSTKDIADTVRSNTPRFIDIFRKNKKISWNWGGFFFGAYYLFFRKMYKQGIAAMAVNLISSLIINGIYVEQTAAFNNFINMHYEEIMNGASVELAEQMMAVMQPLMPAAMILMCINISVNVIIALFADRFYKNKVMSVIEKVEKDIEEGEILTNMGFIQNEMNLSHEQMKTFYLGKSGGTNVFAPLIAYCLLNLFMSFITKI